MNFLLVLSECCLFPLVCFVFWRFQFQFQLCLSMQFRVFHVLLSLFSCFKRITHFAIKLHSSTHCKHVKRVLSFCVLKWKKGTFFSFQEHKNERKGDTAYTFQIGKWVWLHWWDSWFLEWPTMRFSTLVGIESLTNEAFSDSVWSCCIRLLHD